MVHHSTGLFPFQVEYGMEFPAIPELEPHSQTTETPSKWTETICLVWPKVKTALQKAAEEYKLYADKKRADHKPFQVGDQVYLSTKYLKLKILSRKLGPKYLGPISITQVINPVMVALKLPPLLGLIHPMFHSSLLKLVIAERTSDPPDPSGPVHTDHYKIDRILDSRLHRGKLQFLVQWKGYPFTDAARVAAPDIHAAQLLRRFHCKYPDKLSGPGNMTDKTNPSALFLTVGPMVEGSCLLSPCRMDGRKTVIEDTCNDAWDDGR